MYTVDEHFNVKQPVVREIYDKLVSAASLWGPVVDEPKKTSIHLNRRYAFAGVATAKWHLTLR